MENTNGSGSIVTTESEFKSKSITSLFWKYSLLALAGLVLQGVSGVADGRFMGNGVGSVGLATISVIFPFMTATVALFLLFGIGSSTLAAMKLGDGKVEEARDVYGSLMIFGLFFSVIVAAIVLLNLDAILKLFGADSALLPHARRYAIPFMLAFPLYILGNIAYFFTRLAEKPFAASLSFIGGGILSIVVEYYFVFHLKLGVASSAAAYIIAVGSTAFLIPYLQFSSTPFKLKVSDFKINFGYVKESLKIGFAIFIVQISTVVSTIIINNMILKYGVPELHMAAFGIINAYIAYILTILTNAFVTGIQPIASYNLGAKSYSRVASLVKVGIFQSTIVIVAIMALVFIFADPIVTFFVGPAPELVEATKEAMKIYLILYALGNVSQIVAGYYMAVGKNGLAVLNGLARVIIFAVPLLFILPNYFGLKGVWLAQPCADSLAFILALILIMGETKRLKKMEETL